MDAQTTASEAPAPQPSGGTPAPAAAPASTPASAPSGTPSAPSPGQAPASESGRPSGARDEQGRFVARPIPPNKHRLDGGFESIPDDDFLTDQEKARKAARTTAQGLKPGAPAPAQQPAAPAAPKFSFGGQEWESQEQAEQSFRSLRGIHRSLEQRTSVAEQTARQYHTRLSQLEEQIASTRNGQSGPGVQPAPAASPTPGAGQGAAPTEPGSSDLYKTLGVDLGQFSAIAERDGLDVAAAWLVRETAAKQGEQFQKEMKQTFAPFVQMQERARQVGQVQGVFEQVASYTVTGQDGQQYYAYPELHDPQAAAYIGHFWKQLGFSDDARHRPQSLAAAVALYRDMTRGQAASAQAPTTTTTPAGAPSGAAAAAAAVAQAVVQGSRGTGSDALTGSVPPPVRPSAAHGGFDVEAFKRGIDQAGVNDSWLRR